MTSFMYKMQKLKNMPFDMAVRKVSGKAASILRDTSRKFQLLAFPIRLDVTQFSGYKSSSHFLFDPQNRSYYTEHLVEMQSDQSIIKDADRICSHCFNLLGSGEIMLGEKLPWNEDFKVGYSWKNSFYKHIKIIDLDHPADVKVPWELSRFQHAFTLGKAYWLTNREKYAKEYQDQLSDWMEKNPVEMSVNWTCTMDVAIRAVNWIASAYFFIDSPYIPETFWARFHASLYSHGQFIMRNLENKGEHTGNHYLCNLVGLIALGLYYRDFTCDPDKRKGSTPERWLEFGLQQIEREMVVQVNPDGSNYEASTSYHRLVTECFLVTAVLCSRNGISLSSNYMNRVEHMCQFMLDIMKPDGLTPTVGDADDGRLIIPSKYGSWIRNDFSHLLAVAGEVFHRDDFRHAGSKHQEDALWIAGAVTTLDPGATNAPRSVAYPDGGYYVLRQGEAYCLIRCGDLSFHGHGAHSHNDQLSFELQIGGVDFIIDPGSYVYTADYRMRNLFRSTAMHNTLEVDGKEQNDFEERVLFLMREQTFAKCEGFGENYFAGSHQGYVQKSGIVHRREMRLQEDQLEISDRLEQVSPQAAVPYYNVTFILAPGVKVNELEERIVLSHQRVSVDMTFTNAETTEILPCWVSSRYGERELSQLLRVKGSKSKLCTFIQWSISEKEGI
ncbi:alginate lyase family protein [Paenibacillus sp. GCM10028914]|uniref:heparinase II/III family protein n=1 Tax=Paenibacillus sp. GCM10028914 TaxID=3273416 RepID=UPI00360A9646